MNSVDQIIAELQMVTGVVADDIDYLLYVLLDGGTYFRSDKSNESKYVKSDVVVLESVNMDIDDWFNNLEG